MPLSIYLQLIFLIENDLHLKAEPSFMTLVCCWNKGRLVDCWTTTYNTSIQKLNTYSHHENDSVFRMGPEDIYATSRELDNWLTGSFPLLLFSFPKSSAKRVLLSPDQSPPLRGGGYNKKLPYRKISEQDSDLTTNLEVPAFYSKYLPILTKHSAPSGFPMKACLVNTLSLSIPCQHPADCLQPL